MKELELLTIRQTARKYGLSEAMLRQMEHNGELPGIYTGKANHNKMVNTKVLFEVLDKKSRRCGR